MKTKTVTALLFFTAMITQAAFAETVNFDDTHYFVAGMRRRSKPMSESAIPSSRGHDAGSLKNKMPATAIIAIPPASTIGTADNGPPF